MPLVGGARVAASVLAGLAGIIALWKIIDFNVRVQDLAKVNEFGTLLAAAIDVGFGLYLICLAGLALPAAAWALAGYGRNAATDQLLTVGTGGPSE
jgi:hypothetical protein